MNQIDVEIKEYIPLNKSWIDQPIFSIFESIVEKYPTKLAVSDSECQLTYSELFTKVNTLATFIKNKSKGNKSPIGILQKNAPSFIVSMLSCIKNGIPYVPLDIRFPTQRNNEILEEARVQFVLGNEVEIENKMKTEFVEVEIEIDAICYILYTSGSTGKPKGVYQNQRNMLHDVWQYIQSVKLNSSDRSTLFYSPSVNGAIRDIFGTLLTGASLYIRDIKEKGIIGIDRFLEDNKITIYHSVPTIFRSFLKVSKVSQFKTVRLVYLAGDRIFKSDYDLYKEYFNFSSRLYIGMGSTENATIYRQWFLDHYQLIDSELVPVGFSVEDRLMELVDEEGKEVHTNEVGEIQVTSPFMSLGYWKNEQLTNQSFEKLENGNRVFKTGDLGKINSNGLLEFLGRKDKQIKINGHRLEIDEVIAKISKINGIENCAMLVREGESPCIIAYLKSLLEEKVIRNELTSILPSYAIPSEIYFLEEIPLLSNFKIDTQILKAIDAQNQIVLRNEMVGEDRLELFKAIWTKYTSEKEYEEDVKWSETAANSVDAISFLVELEDVFKINFSSGFIQQDMRPSYIFQKMIECETNENVIIDKNLKPIIYFFPWLCGLREGHEKLIQKIAKFYEVKVVVYPNYKNWEKKKLTFSNVCDELEMIYFKEDRPMIFFGVLSGCYFSHELAYRMKDKKDVISSFLLDNRVYHPLRNPFLKLKKTFKNLFSRHYTSAQLRILLSAQLSKSNVLTYVFSLKKKKIQDDFLGWKRYCKIIHFKQFSFSHKELAGGNLHEKLTDSNLFIDEMSDEFLTLIKN